MVVWSCILAAAVEDIFKIDGITNLEKHPQIWVHRAIPCGKHLNDNSLIWQCVWDHSHAASVVKATLAL